MNKLKQKFILLVLLSIFHPFGCSNVQNLMNRFIGKDFSNEDYEMVSKDKKVSDRELMVEINRCSNLLLRKKIDPKGIATSFCLWKNEYS